MFTSYEVGDARHNWPCLGSVDLFGDICYNTGHRDYIWCETKYIVWENAIFELLRTKTLDLVSVTCGHAKLLNIQLKRGRVHLINSFSQICRETMRKPFPVPDFST